MNGVLRTSGLHDVSRSSRQHCQTISGSDVLGQIFHGAPPMWSAAWQPRVDLFLLIVLAIRVSVPFEYRTVQASSTCLGRKARTRKKGSSAKSRETPRLRRQLFVSYAKAHGMYPIQLRFDGQQRHFKRRLDFKASPRAWILYPAHLGWQVF